MRIGELARATGATARALRHYEQAGRGPRPAGSRVATGNRWPDPPSGLNARLVAEPGVATLPTATQGDYEPSPAKEYATLDYARSPVSRPLWKQALDRRGSPVRAGGRRGVPGTPCSGPTDVRPGSLVGPE
ncbi:MerR family DNA-binding transcriptional regulator [Streptomyces sp. NPDC004542]|uniref:MerR family DNA-binding transcriptional regulator n=1 Tax=Streptomyces sp. NPDC004542 TaxID=3154281 RepID=UPI0033A414F7